MTDEKKVEITPDMIEVDDDGNVKITGLPEEEIKYLREKAEGLSEVNAAARPVVKITAIRA